jgi:hypothetical protein
MRSVDERLLAVPTPATNRWHRAGVSARTERWIDIVGRSVVALLVVGWSWSIVQIATGRADANAPGAIATMAASVR